MNQEIEIIDIEVYAKEGKLVPPNHHYKIRIDKVHYTVTVPTMTGREILTLAGKTPPQSFILQQKEKGHIARIALDEVVDFTKPGVERFMTIPNEVTEGETASMRQQFNLMHEDQTFLESLGLAWETIMENTVRRVIIHGYSLPKGYNVGNCSVSVCLPPGYPDTQIDMAYFSPNLARADGKAIGALSALSFDGKAWQQWSRHRTATSAWRIGEDNLSTHMSLVNDWLTQELSK